VDPRAGLVDVEKRKLLTLPELELRPLGRPARSQSLYRFLTTQNTKLNPFILSTHDMMLRHRRHIALPFVFKVTMFLDVTVHLK
jgi:hypothetical protein